MRSSIVISSLFAALAVASPVHQALHKRAIVYDIVTDIVTVTVTAGQEPKTVKVQKTVFVNPIPATTSSAKPTTTKSRKPKPTTTSAAPPPPPPPPTTTAVTTSSIPPPPPPPPSTTSEAPVVVNTPAAQPSPEPQPTTPVQVAAVVTPSPSPSPAPQSAGGQSSSGDAVRDAAINYHNAKRALHDANPVTWDEGLAADAQKLADKCINTHEIYGSYGQNIAAKGDSRPNSSQPGDIMTEAAEGWYNEVSDFKALGLFGLSKIPDTGNTQVLHFTQFVWKATTKIGCAVSYCGTNGNIFGGGFYAYTTVCNYQVAGNMDGAYAQNVS